MKRAVDTAFGVFFLLAILSFWSGLAAAYFAPDHVTFFGKAFLGFTGLSLIFGLLGL